MKAGFILLFIFSLQNSIAQTFTDTLKRYDEAVQYLSEHKDELKKQWLSLFKGSDKRTEKKRTKEFNYKVSSVVCFLPIRGFGDEITKIDSITKHPMPEVMEPDIYSAKFAFNSFTSDYLLSKGLADTSTSKMPDTFVLNFSKPVNNYLIAEISGHPLRLKQCNVRFMGRTLWRLFVFSNEDKLARVFYSYLDR